jgi:hypothetical protein
MPRSQQAPWYVKMDQFGGPDEHGHYEKALVLSDRDAVPVGVEHGDQATARYRYSVFLLDLPWRECASCFYPHVASGGQALIETDRLYEAEKVYEGAETMMRKQITSPAVVHRFQFEQRDGVTRRVG